MPKLKDLLPKHLFGTKDSKNSRTNGESADAGRLETDALPMPDDTPNDNNNSEQLPSISNTPSTSTEMTAAAVRELSDPNYNSLEVYNTSTNSTSTSGTFDNVGPNGALAMPPVGGGITALASGATMNVHSAQQNVVMQFSNIQDLHFGAVYNINSNLGASATSGRKASVDESEGGKRQLPRKTTSIVAMMQSQSEPSHRMLDTVATHLGEGWKEVMRELGHSDGQIEQAVIDHQIHGGIKEVIYQLLLQWQRGADDGVATLGRLTTLLWEMKYRELVQRMKLVFKAETDKRNANKQ